MIIVSSGEERLKVVFIKGKLDFHGEQKLMSRHTPLNIVMRRLTSKLRELVTLVQAPKHTGKS